MCEDGIGSTQELKRDAIDDQKEIEKQFDKVVDFCVEKAKARIHLTVLIQAASIAENCGPHKTN